ncbi:hypothetical protein AMS68_001425 [Peltaster fructicola]|uniref:Ribosome recycling factor domain-containing protein n=1 Tax=Peltaster fructicola TaxID=286661 RepID=A0A6H0XMR0_9PEZI|nr:hypothetical protein AMS68_001425 [Peltaster fructicola]
MSAVRFASNISNKVSRANACQYGTASLRTPSTKVIQSSTTLPRQIRCLYCPSTKSSQTRRAFTTSGSLQKKAGKQPRDVTKDTGKETAADDPYDFTTLEADIQAVLERLKNDLSKLRTGGRFNHEVLENLRVQPDKSSDSRVKLNDLAQVIPKGRTIQIIVGEKDHVKQVSSAIQGSDLSLTPQPDPTGSNPQLLEIKIPPPTAESRQAAVKEAVKAGEKASVAVRDARAKQHKKHRAMQLAKSAKPDDLTKAAKQMEKVVESGQQDVKKAVDNAKKVLESS